jgi:hypothetical protein
MRTLGVRGSFAGAPRLDSESGESITRERVPF